MVIRYYGFLSNSVRKDLLPLCRKLLEKQAPEQSFLLRRAVADEMFRFVDSARPRLCPVCGEGFVRIVERIMPELLMSAKGDND